MRTRKKSPEPFTTSNLNRLNLRVSVSVKREPKRIDRKADKGCNAFRHCNVVHMPILFPKARKIPCAEASVDKRWKKTNNLRSKDDVIREAQKQRRKVHSATLVDHVISREQIWAKNHQT